MDEGKDGLMDDRRNGCMDEGINELIARTVFFDRKGIFFKISKFSLNCLLGQNCDQIYDQSII